MSNDGSTAVYVDTNIIIVSVEGDDGTLLHLFTQAARGRVELRTSELTLTEVLVAPMKQGNDALVGHYEDLLGTVDLWRVVPVSRAILRQAAALQAELGNKGMDSIHLATAAEQGCRFFLSSDRRLRLPPGMTRVSAADVHKIETLS
jgi:predicted nucleic acid-binding protein